MAVRKKLVAMALSHMALEYTLYIRVHLHAHVLALSLLYSCCSSVISLSLSQVSSSFGEQFILQAESAGQMNDWYSTLQTAVHKVVCVHIHVHVYTYILVCIIIHMHVHVCTCTYMNV